MGAWGYAPWDNDVAADWYANIFDKMPLASEVEATLALDPEDHADEIRAAAALLIMLGRTYVWPTDVIDRHLALAVDKMERVHALYADEPEFADAIAEELEVLRSRLANLQDGAVIAQPESWGSFWS